MSTLPHIIWVVADDFGFNDWGVHNRENVGDMRTPELDSLASSPGGAILMNAYSQPICSPTRSQLLSGRHQIHTGLQHGVIWPAQPNGLPLNETTIAEHLRTAGFATHAVGKWHVGFFERAYTPLRRGFDSFFGFWGGGEDHYTHVSGGGFDFRSGEETHWAAAGEYSTNLIAGETVAIIERHAASEAATRRAPLTSWAWRR